MLDATRTIESVRWHPSENYLAVVRASGTGSELFMYSFDGSTLALTATIDFPSGPATAIAWKPDGSYIIVNESTNSASELRLYKFTAGALAAEGTLDIPGGNRSASNEALSWDPTGTYIAFGLNANFGADTDLKVYKFTAGAPATLSLDTGIDLDLAVLAVDWHPTEPLILIGTDTGDRVRVYEHFPATALVEVVAIDEVLEGQDVRAAMWHPDGDVIVFGADVGSSPEIGVYCFKLATNELVASAVFSTPTSVDAARWSPSGAYFAVGTTGNDLRVYKFSREQSDLIISGVYRKVCDIQTKVDLILALVSP